MGRGSIADKLGQDVKSGSGLLPAGRSSGAITVPSSLFLELLASPLLQHPIPKRHANPPQGPVPCTDPPKPLTTHCRAVPPINSILILGSKPVRIGGLGLPPRCPGSESQPTLANGHSPRARDDLRLLSHQPPAWKRIRAQHLARPENTAWAPHKARRALGQASFSVKIAAFHVTVKPTHFCPRNYSFIFYSN